MSGAVRTLPIVWDRAAVLGVDENDPSPIADAPVVDARGVETIDTVGLQWLVWHLVRVDADAGVREIWPNEVVREGFVRIGAADLLSDRSSPP